MCANVEHFRNEKEYKKKKENRPILVHRIHDYSCYLKVRQAEASVACLCARSDSCQVSLLCIWAYIHEVAKSTSVLYI